MLRRTYAVSLGSIVLTVCFIAVYGGWLWWMGYHHGRADLLDRIQMFVPQTTQHL